jgi:PPM family protein phosphatase
METKPELPAVECAHATDSGRDPEKQVNEDAYGYEKTPFGHLCVVCDGMGGHQNGREASTLAVQAIVGAFANAPAPVVAARGVRGRELLQEAIIAANARVCALGASASKQERPGCTVVAILMHPDGVEVAHVGDSRCYLIQGDQIFQITKDHTVVQKLVDAGLLTPAQAAVHPDANQILRALGSSPEVEVEVRAQTIPVASGDTFVLCSDGLSDLVNPKEVLRVVSAAPPARAVGELVDLANARGGHDNVTIMILRVRDSSGTAREVAPTVAQTLVEVPPPQAPVQGLGGAAPVESAPPGAAAGVAPMAPTVPMMLPVAAPPPPERRGFPVAVAFGVLLAVLGFGAAGFAIYLVLNPTHDARNVAPFALTGLPLASPPSSVALVPVAPEAPPAPVDAGLEAGPPLAPLPSLVPPRPFRHGRGS